MNSNESVYAAAIEDIDKKDIYEKCSEIMFPSIESSIRERRIIEAMVIDSIVEENNYLNEQWQNAIWSIFLNPNLRYMPVYSRLIFLYPLYCKKIGKEESAKTLVERYVMKLERELPETALKKIYKLKNYDYYEISDYRNNSSIYRKKIEGIKRMGECTDV